MRCTSCNNSESKVIDTRPTEDGSKIRRRRECTKCGTRFTTYEMIETVPLMVIKKDQTRQMFERQKLMNGIIRACVKRPVSVENMESIVTEIERYCSNAMLKEITSTQLGEMVLEKLINFDPVAYIRFASVYREFGDIDSFIEELELLRQRISMKPEEDLPPEEEQA